MTLQQHPSTAPAAGDTTSRDTTRRSGHRRRGLLGAVAVSGALIAGVTVASANSNGGSTAALPGPAALAASPVAGAAAFVPVTPVRVLDTRGAPNGPIGVPTVGPMTGGKQIDLPLAGAGKPIPAGATSAVLNIAIDQDATLQSFLTIWPQGEAKPFTAANNAVPGVVAANFTIAKLGTTGGISLFNQQGNVNVVIDLVGYTVPVDTITEQPAALSAWGTFATPTNIAAGAPIPFAQAGPIVGTDVTQADADTFTFARAGVYRVDYRVTSSASSPLGTLQLALKGTPTGPTNALTAVNGVLTDSVLVTAQAGDTLELVVQSTGIGLAAGTSTRISIELVQTTPTTTTTVPSSTTTTVSPSSTSSSTSTTTI